MPGTILPPRIFPPVQIGPDELDRSVPNGGWAAFFNRTNRPNRGGTMSPAREDGPFADLRDMIDRVNERHQGNTPPMRMGAVDSDEDGVAIAGGAVFLNVDHAAFQDSEYTSDGTVPVTLEMKDISISIRGGHMHIEPSPTIRHLLASMRTETAELANQREETDEERRARLHSMTESPIQRDEYARYARHGAAIQEALHHQMADEAMRRRRQRLGSADGIGGFGPPATPARDYHYEISYDRAEGEDFGTVTVQAPMLPDENIELHMVLDSADGDALERIS